MIEPRSLSICGETLYAPIHACAFFDSRDDQYEVILPFMKEGLDNNEKVVNILEAACHHEHCRRLAHAGIGVEERSATSQLNILASEDTYLKGGSFTADKMLHLLEEALLEAKREGYESVRACGEMVWALKSVPGTDQLIEYESRLNLLTPKHSCSLVCMYDVSRFSGRVLADVLSTHQYVIMNRKVHKNPYYIEPHDFLPIYQLRNSSPLPAEV